MNNIDEQIFDVFVLQSLTHYRFFYLAMEIIASFKILFRMDVTAYLGPTWFVPHTKYYSDDQINKNEMGEACNTKRREEKCMQDFGEETWRKETTRNTLK